MMGKVRLGCKVRSGKLRWIPKKVVRDRGVLGRFKH